MKPQKQRELLAKFKQELAELAARTRAASGPVAKRLPLRSVDRETIRILEQATDYLEALARQCEGGISLINKELDAAADLLEVEEVL